MIASDGGYRTGQGRADANVMEECARSGKICVCVFRPVFPLRRKPANPFIFGSYFVKGLAGLQGCKTHFIDTIKQMKPIRGDKGGRY